MPNRNVESHFALEPGVSIQRSRFDMSFGNKTSFNVGDLIPLCRPIEVLPGDTFSIDTSKVVRLQTLLKPVMDNLYLDTYWFFVPYRLVWEHWKQFMGENTESAWLPQTEYSIPTVKTSSSVSFPLGSIADYMGLPVGVNNISEVSALPFRAYALVCDEWFRSENLTDPLNIPKGDSSITFDPNAIAVSQPAQGGSPFKVAKYFDYFTAALPSPQKGPNVAIPLGGEAPVYSYNRVHDPKPARIFPGYPNPSDQDKLRGWFHSSATDVAVRAEIGATGSKGAFSPINLWADLGSTTSATINALRTAFQIQRLYERDARGGTRYIEIIRSHFGVTSPDSRLQRPEYLGGNRIPINISEVTNNSQGEGTPLGDLGAMSKTTDVHSDLTHSFTEHGVLLCLGCARIDHSYQNGIHRSWLRKNRLDFYWPVLANLGEQAVLRKEIFAMSGDAAGMEPTENAIFGYQERWAEYRYQPNMITGMLRSASNSGLDTWHFADDYETAPTLSDAWIREDKTNVDRALAVNSTVANQIFGDFWFNIKATRCMPVYSVPGLIDHH